MFTKRVTIAVSVLLLLVAIGCERKTVTNTEIIKEVAPSDAAHIGSAECGTCHAATYASFQNTGHPFKVNEAEDAQDPSYYPYTNIPSPPAGVSWDQVDKVIGGFRWKARFIDHDGYIITGTDVQYNFIDESWTAYHDGEHKPYACGPCHMTDYKSTGNQEGKEGLVGTWEFNGIQCEECHGPGELHAGTPYDIGMVIDRSNEGCGKCHIRGDVNQIPASGGFIKHHEQWNEMFTTKHSALQCVDCHDVHVGLHPLNPERESAIKISCGGCHLEEAASFEASSINHAGSSVGPECIDCHMARAAKSAVAAGTYEGDIRSHLFRINTSASAEMFTEDGAFANGYLTLEYTCLQCHDSETKAWAAEHANQVHSQDIETIADCFDCHDDAAFGLAVKAIQGEYDNSVHAAGENVNRNRNNTAYYASCEKCHSSEGFIAQVTGEPASGEHFSAIDCFTCHEPHTSGGFGVRVEAAVTLANDAIFDRGDANLCASCHQSRRNASTTVIDGVELSSHWGPHHSNQADMLIAENAYEYATYTYSVSPHANVATNGCVDCHMSAPLHESVGGHSWNMRNEDRGFENRSGCNVAACHDGDIDDLDRLADADYDWDGTIEGIQAEVSGLLDSLGIELEAVGIAELVDSSYHPVDERVVGTADSAGALYNFLFVEEDRSHGVHNTDYAVGLLQSSINFLTTGDPNGAPGTPRDTREVSMGNGTRTTLSSH